jgi:hypothetical protein
MGEEISDADKALIAASPAMFKALRSAECAVSYALACIPSDDLFYEKLMATLRTVRSAIALAVKES